MENFSMPMDFMENFIFKAPSEYAMVYLYAYKFAMENKPVLPIKSIAENLNMDDDVVFKATEYWKEKGFNIFYNQNDESKKDDYTSNEISDALDSDKQFLFIKTSVEQQMGKILSTADIKTLFYIYDYLGYDAAGIMMIVNYAVKENKGRMRYIEKLALSWSEKNIVSPKEIEEYLNKIEDYKTYLYHIKTMLGINNRDFTPSEKKLIFRWENEIKPTDDEIIEALEICVERTSKISLKYINGIFENKRNGQEKNKFKNNANFSQRSKDKYHELEKIALSKRIKESSDING